MNLKKVKKTMSLLQIHTLMSLFIQNLPVDIMQSQHISKKNEHRRVILAELAGKREVAVYVMAVGALLLV